MSTTAPFQQALARTLQFEGGYSNNPADSGGETNFGITKATAVAAGYTGDMHAIPAAVVERVYRQRYWDVNRLDNVAGLAPDLAAEVFDYGVNAGPKTAAEAFQEALNLCNEYSKTVPDLVVDGVIGQGTLDALARVSKARRSDIVLVLKAIRLTKYVTICRGNVSQRVFLRGWCRRAFAGVAP